MRNFVLLLILVNLAVAAWWHWSVEPPVGEARLTADVPRLELLPPRRPEPPGNRPSPAEEAVEVNGVEGEVEADAPDAAPDAQPDDPGGGEGADAGNGTPTGDAFTGIVLARAAPPPEDDSRSRCIALGPFAGEDAMAGAAARLEAAGFSPREARGEGRAWLGHWVQVVEPDAAVAADVAAALRAAGIDDAYVIPGDDVSRVSLGVYSSRARADAASERARSLGLEHRVQDRYRDATVHWLEIETGVRVLPDAGDMPAAADGGPPSWQPCDARG